MSSSAVSLGVDIGGTRVRAGVVDDDGRILARRDGAIPPEGDPDQLRRAVRKLAREAITQAGVAPAKAGVALPGVWDPETLVMRKAVNLPRLEGTHLPTLFSEALNLPVRLEADSNAAAWGQYQRLAPRPARLLYLSLGTGVGGAVILDGQLVRMTRGGAGHFGFLIVDTQPGAPAGRNGVPGCLSAIAAGPALHLAATGAVDNAAIGAEALSEVVLQRAAQGLAVAFMNLVHVFAPDCILLGGGVIDRQPGLVVCAREAFRAFRSPLIPEGFAIRQAPLTTDEAGVIGAALLRHA